MHNAVLGLTSDSIFYDMFKQGLCAPVLALASEVPASSTAWEPHVDNASGECSGDSRSKYPTLSTSTTSTSTFAANGARGASDQTGKKGLPAADSTAGFLSSAETGSSAATARQAFDPKGDESEGDSCTQEGEQAPTQAVLVAQTLVFTALKMLMLLPFHGNSRPAHRQLLAAMTRLPAPWLDVFCEQLIHQVRYPELSVRSTSRHQCSLAF